MVFQFKRHGAPEFTDLGSGMFKLNSAKHGLLAGFVLIPVQKNPGGKTDVIGIFDHTAFLIHSGQ